MCLEDCLEVGPPPDSILNIPPPPLHWSYSMESEGFLQNHLENEELCLLNMSFCHVWFNDGDFLELPVKDENWNINSDDNLLLISIITAILCLALLGCIFTLIVWRMKKSERASANCHLPIGTSKTRNFKEESLPEKRIMWATLTPQGTRHTFCDKKCKERSQTALDYEYFKTPNVCQSHSSAFENNGFADYNRCHSRPNIRKDVQSSNHSILLNGLETAKTISCNVTRPIISSPTKIEVVYMPPLNSHRYKNFKS